MISYEERALLEQWARWSRRRQMVPPHRIGGPITISDREAACIDQAVRLAVNEDWRKGDMFERHWIGGDRIEWMNHEHIDCNTEQRRGWIQGMEERVFEFNKQLNQNQKFQEFLAEQYPDQ